MGDQRGIARIGQNRIKGFDQAEPPIGLPQQQNAAVAGNLASVKVRFNFATIKAWKTEFFLGTVWH